MKHDPVVQLMRNLQLHTLDPRFEKYGNFILDASRGRTLFWGNFIDFSAVFRVVTNDRKLIDVIIGLINENKQSEGYLAAKREYAKKNDQYHDKFDRWLHAAH